MSTFDRDKCVATMKRLRNKVKDRVADPMWHYTNAEAFTKIIESKELWMTNARFVNDTTELRTPLEKGLFDNIEFINREFDVFKNESKRPEPEDYYLASFSKDGNSLYQFRSYGNYSIGFDSTKLAKVKRRNFPLFNCVYKQKDIKQWIIRKDKLSEWQDECFDNEDGASYKRSVFYNVRYAQQAKLKSKYYESEKEIRLLVVSNSSWDWYNNSPETFCEQPAIYFQNRDLFDVQVPYVKFFIPKEAKTREELEQMVKGKSQVEAKQVIKNMEMEQERELLPITGIRIGPMPHQKEEVSATKIFLRENGYHEVDVIPSEIPFRG